ncbi:MAG TPA: family 43 glycosylhydrolase, partial [Actinopolymorphaceae bacterium]
DGWYYLFASSANCCAGPTTGYTVFVGRSRSPLGPFVDKYGDSMLASRTGGTPVIAPNGNKFIGTGHHSAALDLSGETYMAYHAIDRNDPWLDVSPGFTMRPMNIDRMDWIDGWPIVRAGLGASDDEQPAPVTRGESDNRFEDGEHDFRVVKGKLTVAPEDTKSDSGRFASLDGALALGRPLGDRDVRVEADVRTAGENAVGVVARGNVRALLDKRKRELRVEAPGVVKRAKLPENFDFEAWHVLALEVRGRTVTADVTDARLSDPWAIVEARAAAAGPSGSAGVVGTGEVDNFSAHPLYRPVTKAVPAPKQGKLDRARSDEFTAGLGDGWTWLREDSEAKVEDGALRWPTQTADLVGDGTPGVLFRDDMPEGDYTIETKLTLDLGEDDNRNFQQAGFLVHLDDDDFLRYDVVAVGGTRITEFGKETVFDGRRSWGGGVVGAPGETTWLRLVHTRHPETGEHLYRAGSSNDGKRWTWGLTWTLPADAEPRIGLVSHGSTPETTEKYGPALAQFDYFRVYRH